MGSGAGAVSAVAVQIIQVANRGMLDGLRETLPVETACAVEEFKVERSYNLTVNLTIGGDLHRHD